MAYPGDIQSHQKKKNSVFDYVYGTVANLPAGFPHIWNLKIPYFFQTLISWLVGII